MTKENKGHKNLKPAKKGEVRNPKGRPVGARGVETLLRDAMRVIVRPEDFKKFKIDPKSKFDPRLLMLGQLTKNAFEAEKVSDSTNAAKELWDRMDGKAVAKVEQTNEDVTPKTITFEEITKPEHVRDTTPDNDEPA